jgi:cytochrome c biogenesis protein ResB
MEALKNPLLRALTSMRLAVVLIAWLFVGCVTATLVPGPGFSDYFDSILFLLPVALFFMNLAACSLRRFLRARRAPAPRRHGPDILHAGLLLLLVAAALSATQRRGGVANLSVGDAIELPGGARVTLVGLSSEKYDDGRPKDWTSLLRVERDGRTLIEAFPLRVNHPLSIGGVKLYQASRSEDASGIMVVRDAFFGLVLASLAIAAAGLAITFAQKSGDQSK